MRISDWSSDVCASDLFKTERVTAIVGFLLQTLREHRRSHLPLVLAASYADITSVPPTTQFFSDSATNARLKNDTAGIFGDVTYKITSTVNVRSEEHTLNSSH